MLSTSSHHSVSSRRSLPPPPPPLSHSVILDRLSSAVGLGETKTKTKTTPRHRLLREEGRAASVMVLISRDGHVLLTLRSEKLRSHPGQVSFPGGRMDASDNGDDVRTALRETMEEVGLDYTHLWKNNKKNDNDNNNDDDGDDDGDDDNDDEGLRIVCTMPTTEAMGRLCVTPVVAVHTTKTWKELHGELRLSADEVQTAFWAPLGFVLEHGGRNRYLRECYEVLDWPVEGESFTYRAYDYDGFVFDEDDGGDGGDDGDDDDQDAAAAAVATPRRTFAVTGLTADILLKVAGVAYQRTSGCAAPPVEEEDEYEYECKDGGDGDGDDEFATDDAELFGDYADMLGENGPLLRGVLKRKIPREGGKAGDYRWTEGCFVLVENGGGSGGGGNGGGGMLHQYDSVEQALRKQQAANKKNRLRLMANTPQDTSLTSVKALTDDDDGVDGDDKKKQQRFSFGISTLGGRVVWELATPTAEERAVWMRRIESIVNSNNNSC